MLQLKLDPDSINRRATFMENGNNVLDVNTTVNTIESCLEYDASVKYSLEDVYKPIHIEMHYQLLNPVPQSDSGIDHNGSELNCERNNRKFIFRILRLLFGCQSRRSEAGIK